MKKIILLCIVALLSLSANAALIPERTIRSQEALNSYQLATVPGFKVVLNEHYAHYVSKTGPEHFVISRMEYDRRYAYEKEMKRIQREREQLQKSLQKIAKTTRR